MAIEDESQKLLNYIRLVLDMISEGRYEKIDIKPISQQAPSIARALTELMGNIDRAEKNLNSDVQDLSIIKDHLDHITQTTESGVLSVINTAETIMSDSNAIRDTLETLDRHTSDNDDPELKPTIENANMVLDTVQNNCFSILTSLELEDINRQLMERIVKRLDEIQGNLLQLLSNFNIEKPMEKKDSAFLESLKHIVDLEDNSRQSQEDIDDLFEDFSA